MNFKLALQAVCKMLFIKKPVLTADGCINLLSNLNKEGWSEEVFQQFHEVVTLLLKLHKGSITVDKVQSRFEQISGFDMSEYCVESFGFPNSLPQIVGRL